MYTLYESRSQNNDNRKLQKLQQQHIFLQQTNAFPEAKPGKGRNKQGENSTTAMFLICHQTISWD